MFSLRSICLIWMLAFCCLWHTVTSVTHSQIGDVQIHMDGDKWQCDQIECPPATYRCYVSKRKLHQDDAYVWRTNICYSKGNVELKSRVIRQPVRSSVKVNLVINSYRSGAISTYNTMSSSMHNFEGSSYFKSSSPHDIHNFYDHVSKQFVMPPILKIPSIAMPHIPSIPSIHIPSIPSIHIPAIPPIHMPHIPTIPAIHIPHIPSIHIPDIPEIPSVVMHHDDFSLPDFDNMFHSDF